MANSSQVAAPIKFVRVPKDVRTWTRHQKRYVRSLILAAIYRPSKREDREPVRRALSVHVANKMAKGWPKLSPEDDALYKKLCRLILDRFDSIVEAPSARQILSDFELKPDAKDQKGFIKGVYAVGRTVEALYRMKLTSAMQLKPSVDAGQEIVKRYFVSYKWHPADPEDAWERYKPIAHLAGAWIILFPPIQGGELTRKNLSKLCRKLPQFLANASALRNFLISPEPGKKRVFVSASDCRPLADLEGLPLADIPWKPFSATDIAEIHLKTAASRQRK